MVRHSACTSRSSQPLSTARPFCSPVEDGLLYIPIGVLGSIGFLAAVSVIGWIIYVCALYAVPPSLTPHR